METYIAYFDYLGFKDFIEKNSLEYQQQIMDNNFRDIERAIGQGKHKPSKYGVISDISESKLNCMNFSDTIVFWTNDTSVESLNELLKVAFTYNWQSIIHYFPLRGSLVYGELIHVDYRQETNAGGKYNLNSLFGKGLVKAHIKAESQNWAGTVIDKSFIEGIIKLNIDFEQTIKPYVKQYKIPYKVDNNADFEYAFRLVEKDITKSSFERLVFMIDRNFKNHNKSFDNSGVKEKFENTIEYLRSFIVK